MATSEYLTDPVRQITNGMHIMSDWAPQFVQTVTGDPEICDGITCPRCLGPSAHIPTDSGEIRIGLRDTRAVWSKVQGWNS